MGKINIQDLYVFACKNNLFNEDIYTVIEQFKTSLKPIQTVASCNVPFEIDKIEWTYEEVLELFSS